jgi:Peroxidase
MSVERSATLKDANVNGSARRHGSNGYPTQTKPAYSRGACEEEENVFKLTLLSRIPRTCKRFAGLMAQDETGTFPPISAQNRSELVAFPTKHEMLTKTSAAQIRMMFIQRSILLLSLLLAAAEACPYLAREQDKQHDLGCRDTPNQNSGVRRAQVTPPTSVEEAIQTATTMITQIVTDDPPMGAKCIRLSFHDCVGGICDGCVELASPSNFGLKAPIDALDPVVQICGPYLTPGDVWALCGLVSARVSQKVTSVEFPLQFVGRPHCAGGDTTGGPHRILPSAHFTTNKVVTFFANEFGFTESDTVAILGAHSRYVLSLTFAFRLSAALVEYLAM